MAKKNNSVIFPIGSFEQHSQFGSMATDSIIASEIARMVSDRLCIPLIPHLPYGISKVHKDFYGTIFLRDETMVNVILDVIRSLNSYGIINFIIINGHGGNKRIFKKIYDGCSDILIRFYEFSWWELVSTKYFDIEDCSHAGSQEISVLSAINDNLVRHNMVVDMLPNPKFNGKYFENIRDVTLNGVLGNARNYDIRIGMQIIDDVVETICNGLNEVLINDY